MAKVTKTLIVLAAIILYAFGTAISYGQNGADWTGTCASGKRQSPINFQTNETVEANDVKLELTFSDISSGSVYYNDTEGKVQVSSTSNGNVSFTAEEETSAWTMAQFHFHAPSEHTVDSKQYDLEMHTVTTNNADGAQYLVVGMFWELDTNAEDDPFLESLNLEALAPGTDNAALTADSTIPYKDLMEWAEGKQTFNYQGGLTTPDCTEAVDFFIVREPRKINSKQLTYFNRLWKDYSSFSGAGTGQYRSVQSLNRRQVFTINNNDDDDILWKVLGPILGLIGALLIIGVTAFAVWYIMNNRQGGSSSGKGHEYQPSFQEEDPETAQKVQKEDSKNKKGKKDNRA